jgi:hypothetical protein
MVPWARPLAGVKDSPGTISLTTPKEEIQPGSGVGPRLATKDQ